MFYRELVALDARIENLSRSRWRRMIRLHLYKDVGDDRTLADELQDDRDNEFRERVIQEALEMRYGK